MLYAVFHPVRFFARLWIVVQSMIRSILVATCKLFTISIEWSGPVLGAVTCVVLAQRR